MSGNSKRRATAAGSLAGIALAAGVTWAPPGEAVAGAAAAPTVDATHLTLKCNTVSAKLKFSPGLHTNGNGGGAGKLTVKGESCSTSDPATGGSGNVAIIAVLIKGSFTYSSASCSAITDGSEILNMGSLTYKEQTPPGAPKLTYKESIVTGMVMSSSVDPTTGQVTFGNHADPTAVEFGNFAGIDNGAQTQLVLGNSSFLTEKDKCDKPGGLKTIAMGDGSVFLG
jgi:hypothetical protein